MDYDNQEIIETRAMTQKHSNNNIIEKNTLNCREEKNNELIEKKLTDSRDDSDCEKKTLAEAPRGRVQVFLKRRDSPGGNKIFLNRRDAPGWQQNIYE